MLILAVALVLFLSTLIRSTFGFGDALIAMPLLTVMIGKELAVPVFALLTLVISGTILIRNWRSVHFKSAWKLVLSSALGVPLGILLLQSPDDTLFKFLLAGLLILFSIYNLLKPRLLGFQNDLPAYPIGFVAGILGSAYNTNGPLVVIFGTLRGWSPGAFRATMQGYFFPTGLFIAGSHAVSGLWTQTV
ncbi:MAG: sulfite exporter TauE/SafE family protein, partial [Bacteroidota bacterium]